MNNKLGIADENIINKLVDLKMNFLNNTFTFNEEEKNLNYLKKIHAYLYGDIYDMAGNFSKRVNDELLDKANNLVKYIISLFEYINYDKVFEEINQKIKELADLQLFDFGNDKAISSYCKILLDEYKMNKNNGSI